MDRATARRNLRSALIAGAIILLVFGAAFFTGYVY